MLRRLSQSSASLSLMDSEWRPGDWSFAPDPRCPVGCFLFATCVKKSSDMFFSFSHGCWASELLKQGCARMLMGFPWRYARQHMENVDEPLFTLQEADTRDKQGKQTLHLSQVIQLYFCVLRHARCQVLEPRKNCSGFFLSVFSCLLFLPRGTVSSQASFRGGEGRVGVQVARLQM